MSSPNFKAADHKTRIPRARVRRQRIRKEKPKFDSDNIDKTFTKFLRSRTGRKWSSVFKSIRFFCRNLSQEHAIYVKSMYELYVELHPVIDKTGHYFRSNGLPFGDSGLFYVDAGGFMREAAKEENWRMLS